MRRKNKRVAVMMSGGVDSSVAAAVLKQRGFEVIGVTMHLWDYETTGRNPEGKRGCCDISDQHDARVVCDQLKIPHLILDMRHQFLESVVRPFEQSYIDGETPNPCVLCNSRVKWGSLLGRAEMLECDLVATGHYARIVRGKQGIRLEKGRDRLKDQSYALWEIPRSALEQTLLPVGGKTKAEIRRMAAQLNLRTARKEESQDICFVPDHYQKHLNETQSARIRRIGEGKIVDQEGKVLGKHNGYFGFTIGQRRGLNIGDGHGPYFVSAIKPLQNTVVVGRDEDLFSQACEVRDVNWLSFAPPADSGRCRVKIRYSDKGTPATIRSGDDNGKITVQFDRPVRAITPGQSAVWYRGNAVWGGGVIDRDLKSSGSVHVGDAIVDMSRK